VGVRARVGVGFDVSEGNGVGARVDARVGVGAEDLVLLLALKWGQDLVWSWCWSMG
jgi:hypothetical protein